MFLLLDLPPGGSITHPGFNYSHISASYRRELRRRSSLSLADVRFSAALWQKLFFWQIRPMFTQSENTPVKAASVRVCVCVGWGWRWLGGGKGKKRSSSKFAARLVRRQKCPHPCRATCREFNGRTKKDLSVDGGRRPLGQRV